MADPLRNIDVSKLDPEFYGNLLGFLGGCKAHGLDLLATYGFRTYQEQEALYQKHLAGGPLAAPPGHSMHEQGKAMDFLAYRNGQVLNSSNEPEYVAMEEIAPRYRLKTLRSIGDAGHVELDETFSDVTSGHSTV
jgi:hypothetical protein